MTEAELCLSTLPHRSLNELLKNSLFSTVKQIKTVAEFINKVCLIKEHAATQLLQAVETFKKKGNEIKKESQGVLSSVSETWEALLTDTEDEAKELLELSQKLVNSISVPLFDSAAKKKNLIKKVFSNRESLEVQVDKTEETLGKCFKDYSDSWSKYKLYSKDPQKEQRVSTICFNCHNDYVWQLNGFNRTNEVLYETIIPELLTDAQETLNDVGGSYSMLMQQFTKTHQDKLSMRLGKLQSLEGMFRRINVSNDVCSFTRALGAGKVKIPVKSHENPDESATSDVLGTKLLLNPLTEPALKRKYYSMNKKVSDFVNQVDKEQTALKSLRQLKHSYIDNPSYGNPDGMSEDIMKNDFELKLKRLQLAVLSTQVNLFTKDMINDMGPMEGTFDVDDNNADGYTVIDMVNEKAAHQFVAYIARKPGLCAYCKGVLIGIVKPTVRCKVCKQVVHQRCEMNVPYCSGAPTPRPLSKLLAIRSKSIDSRTSTNEEEEDEDSHVYSDIDIQVPPKTRRRRHSGSSADGRAVFVNGSYGSSPNIVPSPPEIPTKPALKKKPEQCVILYNYEANSPGDLSIKAGQRVTLLNSSSADWWEGSYRGKVGFFPASYSLKLREKDIVLKCLYDFEGEEEDELSISEGQILVLVEDEGNGWMVGRGVDGEGIFPSTYVERFAGR